MKWKIELEGVFFVLFGFVRVKTTLSDKTKRKNKKKRKKRK